MDTQNDMVRADRKMLEDLRRGKAVVGVKQLKKALASGKAVRVFLAEDADPALTDPIAALCRQSHIECAWVSSMKDLGNACGIDVGAAAAAAVA